MNWSDILASLFSLKKPRHTEKIFAKQETNETDTGSTANSQNEDIHARMQTTKIRALTPGTAIEKGGREYQEDRIHTIAPFVHDQSGDVYTFYAGTYIST